MMIKLEDSSTLQISSMTNLNGVSLKKSSELAKTSHPQLTSTLLLVLSQILLDQWLWSIIHIQLTLWDHFQHGQLKLHVRLLLLSKLLNQSLTEKFLISTGTTLEDSKQLQILLTTTLDQRNAYPLMMMNQMEVLLMATVGRSKLAMSSHYQWEMIQPLVHSLGRTGMNMLILRCVKRSME